MGKALGKMCQEKLDRLKFKRKNAHLNWLFLSAVIF